MQYIIHNDQFRKAIEGLKGEGKVKFMLRELKLYIFPEGEEEITLYLVRPAEYGYNCSIHGEIEISSLRNTYRCIGQEDNRSPIYLEIDIQNVNNYLYIKNEKTGWTQYESRTYLHIGHVNRIKNNDNKYTITTEDIRKPVIIEKMANYILGGYTDEEIESGEGIEELYRDIAKQYDEILYYNIKANMFEAKGELRDDIERKLIEMSGETDDDGTFLYPELRKDVYNTEEGWVVDVDDLLEWAEIKEIDTYLYV